MTLICRMLLLALLALGGCSVVGPASISNGRSVYNEVINYTENEQILNLIVRKRYDETFGMLTVASVTSSIKIRATASSNLRAWGTADQVDGNLVPLSIGGAYEENPTISYVPLGGDTFLRRMLRPITMEQSLLLLSATSDRETWYRELVVSANGLKNIDPARPSAGFDRTTTLMFRLRQAGVTDFTSRIESEDSMPTYSFRVHDYENEHLEDVRELLELLGITSVAADGSSFDLPVRWQPGASTSSIRFETRSAFAVIQRAAFMIDLPSEHIDAGLVESNAPGEAGRDGFMTIRSSPVRPRTAVVAVPFRDHWYYIDATDIRSKRSFALLRLLIGMRLEDKGTEQRGPVLTVPVG